MNTGKVALAYVESDLFDRAVRTSAIAQVTTRHNNAWHTFKCRFLECDPTRRYFVLDYLPPPDATLPPLALGQYVGVSFRHSSRKIMLSTVVEAKGRFITSDKQEIAAIRYRWPDAITELQRRAFYRTIVPPDRNLLAHLWPGGVARRQTAQGAPLHILTGRLVDLSCGGCLVRLPGPNAPHWEINECLGMELDLNDGAAAVQLDAHYRSFRNDGQPGILVAVQFVGLEVTVGGNLVLQRLRRAVQSLARSEGASLTSHNQLS